MSTKSKDQYVGTSRSAEDENFPRRREGIQSTLIAWLRIMYA